MEKALTVIKFGFMLLTALVIVHKTTVFPSLNARAAESEFDIAAILQESRHDWVTPSRTAQQNYTFDFPSQAMQFFCTNCWDNRCDGTWCIPQTPPPPCWRCGVGGCGAIHCCAICGEFQCQNDCMDADNLHLLAMQIENLRQAQIETTYEAMNSLMSSSLWGVGILAFIAGLMLLISIAIIWVRKT